MKHCGTVTLETERLIMRRFTLNDADDMFNNWAANPNVTRFLLWEPYKCVEDVRAYIGFCVNDYNRENFYYWVIENKSNHQAIGTISVICYNDIINSAEIGYCLGEEYWHKGIMTEAFKSVIRFLFTEVGTNRIEACHDINNPHSGDVMKKCGLLFEGIHRQAGINNQGIFDKAVYAILRESYTIE